VGPARGEIVVLAGVNGAGKSSVGGAALQSLGGAFYDPDEAARVYRRRGLSAEEASSRAWHRGRIQLERAIREGLNYAFETTLGGATMTRLLLEAVAQGSAVRIWYVGLSTPELHIRRVAERAERGGHPIPGEKIRERWDSSRRNLIRLLHRVTEVVMYDNSRTVDLRRGERPRPTKLLHLRDGRIVEAVRMSDVPDWAKPIFEAAG
jgi:predicted ABC-type ATPase